MITDRFPVSSLWKSRPVTLAALYAFSGGAVAENERNAALDSMLVDFTRSSLNLSLCAVVFDEEFQDANLASQYQGGSVRAERLIQEGGWNQEDALRAHDFVLREDFSFTLSPETTWSSFRREHFTKDHCDNALAMIGTDVE